MKQLVIIKHFAKFFETVGIVLMSVGAGHWFFNLRLPFEVEAFLVIGFLIETIGRILAWIYVGRRPLY